MLRKMIVHTLLATLLIGALATAYQASAQGLPTLTAAWTNDHDDHHD